MYNCQYYFPEAKKYLQIKVKLVLLIWFFSNKMHENKTLFHATTICCVRKNGETAIAGDGQVTFGQSVVMKGNAKKLRTLHNGTIVAGFAGSATDGLCLIDKLESSLEKHSGQMMKSCMDLARQWRSDKFLRQLDAMMIVADKENMLLVSGSGDVIEPEHNALAIGSGGQFAYCAALALLQVESNLTAGEIAKKALEIAGTVCVYTNHNISLEIVSNGV